MTEKRVIDVGGDCQACGHQTYRSANFCTHCASKLDKTEKMVDCSACDARNVYTGAAPSYCGGCGSSLSTNEKRSAPQPVQYGSSG